MNCIRNKRQRKEEDVSTAAATITSMKWENQASADQAARENDRRCSTCRGLGSTIILNQCGHSFHSRCVFDYPIEQCEICQMAVDHVIVYPSGPRPTTGERKGKWAFREEEYAKLLMKEFSAGVLPIGNGKSLRVALSRILNCGLQRCSKKFPAKSLAKRQFTYDRGNRSSYPAHVKKQRQLTELWNQFLWHVAKSKDSGDALKASAHEFWASEFIRFAKCVNQPYILFSNHVSLPRCPKRIRLTPIEGKVNASEDKPRDSPPPPIWMMTSQDMEALKKLKLSGDDSSKNSSSSGGTLISKVDLCEAFKSISKTSSTFFLSIPSLKGLLSSSSFVPSKELCAEDITQTDHFKKIINGFNTGLTDTWMSMDDEYSDVLNEDPCAKLKSP